MSLCRNCPLFWPVFDPHKPTIGSRRRIGTDRNREYGATLANSPGKTVHEIARMRLPDRRISSSAMETRTHARLPLRFPRFDARCWV